MVYLVLYGEMRKQAAAGSSETVDGTAVWRKSRREAELGGCVGIEVADMSVDGVDFGEVDCGCEVGVVDEATFEDLVGVGVGVGVGVSEAKEGDVEVGVVVGV